MAHVGKMIVSVRGIGKRYAGATALDAVDLSIARGSVHALVGENGAGKSTLGKIMAGVVRPDLGEIEVDGRLVSYHSPADALKDGIASIQQEISLVPVRSALENVFLGIEPRKFRLPNVAAMQEQFQGLNERLGFTIDENSLVGTLRTADQQKVEIMRAVARNARLVVMDEPTAALGAEEVEHLLAAISRLKDDGTTVIFVSHRLNEVLDVADTVTVLRNGKVITTRNTVDVTTQDLVTAMLGRSLSSSFPDKAPSPEAGAHVVLAARGIHREGVLDDVSFEVRAGEILGVAGLVGAGRTELARAVFGADKSDRGLIEVEGSAVNIASPRDAIRAGIAMLPESRKDQGLIMSMTVGENVTLAHLQDLSPRGILNRKREGIAIDRELIELDVRPPEGSRTVSTLSGGNQQKVLFSKWLLQRPKVLIVDEPTRGVDIGAKFAIYEILIGLASEGLAVVMISSELEEILELAHRVIVMKDGRIAAELSTSEMTEAAVMNAAFGTGIEIGES